MKSKHRYTVHTVCVPALCAVVIAVSGCSISSSSTNSIVHQDVSGSGARETTVHTFSDGPADGKSPAGGLIGDRAGNLYGTTNGGGSHQDGVVFEINPEGIETVLHAFRGEPADGARPNGPLVMDSAGDLYGTTVQGGSRDYGTVFKISPAGDETLLHSFGGGASDGMTPMAGLIMDMKGNLYGTTWSGGSHNDGTVFKISPLGEETVLYAFTGGTSDGTTPMAPLVIDSTGSLYGTTKNGGSHDDGTVFKISATGKETVLYSFAGGTSDGMNPMAGLIMDMNKNLYGTTMLGGSHKDGTVFRISATGTESVLYSFVGSPTDGTNPRAGLIMDGAGNLYGTTFGISTVFKIDLVTHQEMVLFSFNRTDGVGQMGRLLMGQAGQFYGTAVSGGLGNDGAVYRIQLTRPPTALPSAIKERRSDAD